MRTRPIFHALVVFIVLTLNMPFTVIAQDAFDEDTFVSIDPAEIESPTAGERLTVRINIRDSVGVGGIEGKVTFDPTALRYVSVQMGNYVPAGSEVLSPIVSNNSIIFGADFRGRIKSGDGIAATVTFKVVKEKASKIRVPHFVLFDAKFKTAWDFVIADTATVTVNPVRIPDANLAAAVRKELRLSRNAVITKRSMQKLVVLKAGNRRIQNLTGLEYATQLKELSLWNNRIRDLSPIARLTQLKILSLGQNKIREVNSLARLTRLEELSLGRNQIRNVSPLKDLVNLKKLVLTGNPIQNTSPLRELKHQNPNVQIVIDISIDEPVDATIDVLIFTGDAWWISRSAAIVEAQTTKRRLQSAGIRSHITNNENYVRQWMVKTTSDGSVDVLILYGLIPTTIYPPGNTMRNGSVAENWIETRDGNTILNHADSFGFWSTGNINLNFQVGQRNGAGTLQNLMDIPNIAIPFNRNDVQMIVTADGSTLTPSLNNFQSDRPFPLNQLRGNWYAERIFASNTGNTQATLSDPVIVRDGNRGRIAIVHQTEFENNPKGAVASEIIINTLFATPVVSTTTDTTVVSTPPASGTVISISPSPVISPTTGKQLTQKVNITAGKSVAGYQFTVQFDPTALRYVKSSNGDYLPTGAFFVQPVVNRDRVKLAATALTGVSNGNGTLATLTFEVIAAKASTLTLSDVILSDSEGKGVSPRVRSGRITEPTKLAGDINNDGVVNIQDLVLVASNLGETGTNTADVNGDRVVNIQDLVLVAGALGDTAAAPSLHPQLLEILSAADVRLWLSQAQSLDRTDITTQRGIDYLEQLLTVLIPKETTLLPNYPNPFNPETWIPYQLATDSDVTITIYAADGRRIRTFALGHQPAGMYHSKNRAVYWDGRNNFGERVASSVYFYTLTAGNFTTTRKMLIRK